jgi:hypothetical protein
MIKTWALRGIAGATGLLTLAYLSAFLPGGVPEWGPWLFLAGMSVILVSTMALGAARDGGIDGLRGLFIFLMVLLMGGFGAALALPASEGPDAPLLLGLPLRASLVLYGVGLIPVLIVPFFYARTFNRLALRPGDLERVRDEARAARQAHGMVPVASAEMHTEGGTAP